MENELTKKLNYLEVFQICDSTFPIGTFNHSFGMENYLRTNVIKKAPEFRIWLENYYRSQFRFGEGLLVKPLISMILTSSLNMMTRLRNRL